MRTKNKINKIHNQLIDETPEIDQKIILESAHIHIPKKQQKQSYKFNLKPAFIGVACVMLFGFIIIIGPWNTRYGNDDNADSDFDQTPKNPTDGEHGDGFVGTTLLNEHIEDVFLANVNIILFVDRININYYQAPSESNNIEQINFLNRYLYLTEFYFSSTQFINTEPKIDYQKSVEFTSKDLLNEEINLEISYNYYISNDHEIEIESLVTYKNVSYNINSNISKVDEEVKIESNYSFEDKLITITTLSSKEFIIEVKQNNDLLEESRFLKNENDGIIEIKLSSYNKLDYIITTNNGNLNVIYKNLDTNEDKFLTIEIQQENYIIISPISNDFDELER